MKLKELFESPLRLGSIIPHEILDDPDKNRLYAFKIIRDTKVKKVDTKFNDQKYQLYNAGNQYAFVELDSQSPRIVYYVQYKAEFRLFLGRKCLQQVLVWRNKIVRKTQNLANDVFFNILLPKFGTLITDAGQSPDGEGFWDIRISDALSYGLYVYYVDLMPPRIIEPVTSEKEYERIKNARDAYGTDPKHATRRILITITEINVHSSKSSVEEH